MLLLIAFFSFNDFHSRSLSLSLMWDRQLIMYSVFMSHVHSVSYVVFSIYSLLPYLRCSSYSLLCQGLFSRYSPSICFNAPNLRYMFFLIHNDCSLNVQYVSCQHQHQDYHHLKFRTFQCMQRYSQKTHTQWASSVILFCFVFHQLFLHLSKSIILVFSIHRMCIHVHLTMCLFCKCFWKFMSVCRYMSYFYISLLLVPMYYVFLWDRNIILVDVLWVLFTSPTMR
jgi:hypothetical protein